MSSTGNTNIIKVLVIISACSEARISFSELRACRYIKKSNTFRCGEPKEEYSTFIQLALIDILSILIKKLNKRKHCKSSSKSIYTSSEIKHA